MKKTVFTYGLISGCSMAAMYTSLSLQRNSGNSVGTQVLMYAAVVLLFIIVFAGIRSYRDTAQGGFITFGEAFKVGILISLISVSCYALMWLILFDPLYKGFMETHSTLVIEKLQASGASVEQIAAKKEEMLKQITLYKNPLLRVGIIFVQGFPVEAIMTVVASLMLKKKKPVVS